MKNSPRAFRKNQAIRDMVAETHISKDDLIYPVFIVDGKNQKLKVASMPGIYKYSIDRLIPELGSYVNRGLKSILLFGVPTATDKKDNLGSCAYSKNAIIPKAIKEIKKNFGKDLSVISDVCLCAYTNHGHCGPIINNQVDNTLALEQLSKMALLHAQSGVDVVAPSDMMDFRVAAIKKTLAAHKLNKTLIMSYSVKYASSYYGPFRDVQESSPGANKNPELKHRKTYQMDFRNVKEAIKEIKLDEAEGADILMVKPALPYLDVIATVAKNTSLPLAAYNVSGEYVMAKLYAKAGMASEKDIVLENLIAIKRAGAKSIITYHTLDCLKNNWISSK